MSFSMSNSTSKEAAKKEGVFDERGGSPLGIYYEITVTLKNGNSERPRFEKYVLQSIAKVALPGERVAICFRNRRSKDSDVEVWKHRASQKAFYANLQVCGSVWLCPVCAAKISERRKNELRHAVDAHMEQGGKLAMLTLTFSHTMGDRLKETMAKFGAAVDRFRSGKRYNRIKKKMGLIGTVRSFEITYGNNGWHPHVHILMFYQNEIDMWEVEDELMDLWALALSSTGLSANRKYGLTLQDAEKASDYVSKWGVEHEMTKSHSKMGKKGGMTPFDFLREFLVTGDTSMLDKFREYGEAVKGKRQLMWSRGLKEMFLLEDKTDEQIATEKVEEADLLGMIPYEMWTRILRNDFRAQFLQLVEEQGFDQALEFVSSMVRAKWDFSRT
ncbi:protein rep [Brevibacillus brevis]|uniref:Protein rep n=1 Tax=Brevibacillus brevis TaxID=1393 RepID=A0ABY9TD24_BREBE|nr:protein rep [Brevibacillus brevis]WNC17868.1 protein rep [Brevibacillus brevis]